MDEILRSQEMAQIEEVFNKSFSYERPLVYFPIRHHSPACSFHLLRVIEEYNPDCILVEGPANANELMDIMSDEDTKAPFAIYYSYRDTKGLVSDEKSDYKCYYPFLDYSPELVAVREGKERGILVEFIDLPYCEILIASSEGKGLRKQDEKINYNDDYLLSRNRYLERLIEKAGMRSFDEFWEKYFEINGRLEETGSFVKNMLYYCVLSRMNTDPSGLEEEGCISREKYMAVNIEKRKKDYNRILVVTGGFHTYGLLEIANEQEKTQFPLHSIPKDNQGVYLMAYSMEACDALNGYSSGMPFPGFYQDIWHRIYEGTDCAYKETVLKYIISTGKEVRSKEGFLSTFDEICAFSMVQGLAAIRGKEEPGVYDLWDSILSSYIKGEYNLSTDTPLRILKKKLTGKQVGSLCKNAKIPPIVQYFETKCREFGLKINTSLSNEVTLEIFSTAKHREISEFFYQMEFLETGFARKKKGPNLRLKKDRNLIREIWSYKWSGQVIAALIDSSVYGATLTEACISLVLDHLKKDMDGREATILLIRIFEMGLKEQLPKAMLCLDMVLRKDSDFFSLVESLSNLIMLEELNGLYQEELELSELIRTTYRKILSLLPFMAKIKEEDLPSSMTALMTMYQLMQKDEYASDRELFLEELQTLLENKELQPGLEGCVRGILYGSGRCTASEIEQVCHGYMAGTHEKMLSVAGLLRGLFYTARDLVFVGDSFIKMMDAFIVRIEDDDFMKVLPELRIAFSYFTPGEIDQIAGKVAGYYGKKGRELLKMQEIPPMVYKYGKQLDEMVLELMNIKS